MCTSCTSTFLPVRALHRQISVQLLCSIWPHRSLELCLMAPGPHKKQVMNSGRFPLCFDIRSRAHCPTPTLTSSHQSMLAQAMHTCMHTRRTFLQTHASHSDAPPIFRWLYNVASTILGTGFLMANMSRAWPEKAVKFFHLPFILDCFATEPPKSSSR